MVASALAVAVLGALAVAPGAAPEVDPPEVRLRGPDGRAQLVVSGRGADLTHDGGVVYESLDPSVARVDRSGVVRPSGDGSTRVTVRRAGSGAVASVPVVVEDFAGRGPVRFAGEVVPVLTRLGCNAGACHGKAGGQNGFRLSLLGSDPRADYESLTREGRGRRVFPAAPGSSLVLLKPTARVRHGGGKRLEVGSPEFRTVERWVAQGMPFDPGSEPALTAVEVRPARRRLPPGGSQQLRVVARHADGSVTDVTALARFQSNAEDLAAVDERGRVAARGGFGEAAVMARFGGLVASARVTVPLAADVPAWSAPAPRSFVDRYVDETLKGWNVPPSPPCDDATFARRSSLDLCGLLPRPGEVEALEADADPDKRVKWVDRLLERPEYADRSAMTWSAVLRNRRALGALSRPGTFAFHAWVRQAFAENLPYDRFVAAVLTAKGDAAVNPPVVWYREAGTAESLADDAAQLFLGLRLQCARCHRHPYERWGPDDHDGFAAFFRRVGRKPGADPVTPRVFLLPAGGSAGRPKLLGAAEPLELGPRDDPREALADWLRRPDNPYFARALVNRTWKQFFGRGLVEPEDDLRASNPAVNPELLDALADDFVRHGFDMKRLARLLATSRAYERSSEPNGWNRLDRQGFARFTPRRLAAEVLLDAVDTVAGVPESFPGLPRGTRAVQLPDEAEDTPGRFLDVFGRPKRESVCECERSSEANLAQRLHLLNSEEVERKLRRPDGRAARWAADPRPDGAKVAELYRTALARPPTAEECAVCLAHLTRRRGEGNPRQGFEDLIWALINTKEFQFIE